MLKCLKRVNSNGLERAFLNPRRYAGHSKWSNIKHIKAEKDGEKSAIFSKIRRAMDVAVREKGSSDPKVNLALAQAVEQAKKANMPAASIQTILKKLQEKKKFDVRTLEIKGPNGCAIIVFVETDNMLGLKHNMNSILKKLNGVFSYGTLLHQFTQRGVIRADFLPNMSLENALDDALKIDLDDVEEKDDEGDKYLEFLCQATEVEKKKTQLERLKYVVRSAEIEYIPVSEISAGEDLIKSINVLYRWLREIPEVVNVIDNVAELN